jgi:hypothetical protein
MFPRSYIAFSMIRYDRFGNNAGITRIKAVLDIIKRAGPPKSFLKTSTLIYGLAPPWDYTTWKILPFARQRSLTFKTGFLTIIGNHYRGAGKNRRGYRVVQSAFRDRLHDRQRINRHISQCRKTGRFGVTITAAALILGLKTYYHAPVR